jgi:hypothetical protein
MHSLTIDLISTQLSWAIFAKARFSDRILRRSFGRNRPSLVDFIRRPPGAFPRASKCEE